MMEDSDALDILNEDLFSDEILSTPALIPEVAPKATTTINASPSPSRLGLSTAATEAPVKSEPASKVVFFSEESELQQKPSTTATTTAAPLSSSSLDDYYSSSNNNNSWEEENAAIGGNSQRETFEQEEEEEEEGDRDSNLNDAIPMDKLKNGAASALKFWQWGFDKVKEKTVEVSEQIKQNENVRQASERLGEVYETSVKPGFEQVKDAAAPLVEGIKDGASTAYEKSKPAFEDLGERSKPTLDELSLKAQESWSVTKQKVGEITEACRPTVVETYKKATGQESDDHGSRENRSGGPVTKESGGGDPFADI